MSDKIEDKKIKTEMKKFTKKLKHFKKISSTDMIEGTNIAKELIKEAKEIETKYGHIQDSNTSKKIGNEMNKLVDSLDLYLKNVESMTKFRTKWGVKQ